MHIVVIGGGAAGLVTLKHVIEAHRYFSTDPVEAWLFESEASIGGTFRYRTYEDGELVSSRFLTGFSDFRIPDDSPDFISTNAYCEYLENYATHFNLWPRIKLNTTVLRVRRNEKGGHLVTFTTKGSRKQEQWSCDAVAVCSGLNTTPHIPNIKGLAYVPEVIHSSTFKSRRQFGENKNVMIIGAGETAMDIGYLAITSPTASVTLCHRGGWKNEPKKLPDPVYWGNVEAQRKDIERNGVSPPTDTGFASLFDTAYIHPALESHRWPWEYYDKFTLFYSWLTTGVATGIDQHAGEIQGERHHARMAVANKSNRTQVYISAPYRPKVQSAIEKLRVSVIDLPPPDLKGRHIDLAPFPDHISTDGVVHFKDNGRPEYQNIKNIVCKPDIIVCATGYTQVFPFFDETYPTIFDADIRRIWMTGAEDIAFIGFTRPAFGAIPPLAELQAQLWITNLFKCLPRPIVVTENYLLKPDPDRRLDYIVDHETYAYRLAKDMGSAPSILQVASFGTVVLLTWALGPNFNPKFRLVGPWKWEGAAEIMRGELWRVITRRKSIIIWGLMSIVPMSLFGTLSLLYFLVYGIRDMLLWPLIRTGHMKPDTPPVSSRLRDPSGVKRARAVEDAQRTRSMLGS